MILYQHILLITSFFISTTKPPVKGTDIFTYKIGATLIQIEKASFEGSSSLSFVHLHDNEITASSAADSVLTAKGGIVLSINNNQERLMKFKYGNRYYLFDPNRIFTPQGRATTLKKLSIYNKSAAIELQKFAGYFLKKIENQKTIISIHNNTNDAYSIKSYLKGGALFKEAKLVYVNEELDVDDFFITTDKYLFQKLKDEDFNVVLQNNNNVTDDGSLGIYYGKRNKSYVNVESEHGHLQQQIQMLSVLAAVVE